MPGRGVAAEQRRSTWLVRGRRNDRRAGPGTKSAAPCSPHADPNSHILAFSAVLGGRHDTSYDMQLCHIPIDGSTSAGACAASGSGQLVSGPTSAMEVTLRQALPGAAAARTAAALPAVLSVGSSRMVVGVLELYDRDGGTLFNKASLGGAGDLLAAWLPVVRGHTLQAQAACAEEDMRRLSDMAQEIAQCSSSDDVVDTIVRVTYQLLSPQRVTLFLVNRARQTLTITRSADAEGLEVPMTGSIAGHVAQTGRPDNIPDVYLDSRFDRGLDEATGFRTKSMLCVPVRDAKGTVVAVIQVINRSRPAPPSTSRVSLMSLCRLASTPPHAQAQRGSSTLPRRLTPESKARAHRPAHVYAFSKKDEDIILSMAAHAGVAFRKARLLEETQRARDHAAALLSVARSVASDAPVPKLLNDIVDAAYKVVDAERVSLYLVDLVKDQLWTAVSQDIAGVRIPLGQGIAGTVARKGEVMNIPDAQRSASFSDHLDSTTGFVTRQVLCLPIRLPGSKAPIAVLQCVNKASGTPFDAADQSAMEVFCMEVALALQRRSVEAALLKVLSDSKSADTETPPRGRGARSGRAPPPLKRGLSEYDFQVSLLDLYGDTTTSARLLVDVRRLSLRHMAGQGNPSQAIASVRPERIAPRDPLLSFDFNVFLTNDDDKFKGFARMLMHYALPQRFHVDTSHLANFTRLVRSKYHDNPFHSFTHGWDVMHTTFLLLHSTPADDVLSYLEIFAVIVAALTHDIDHPGHAASYEINKYSPLALEHNDDAVLERHHAHTTFKTLLEVDEHGRQPNNIFQSLAPEDFRHVRKVILKAILATDMAHHFTMVAKLAARAARHAQQEQALDSLLDPQHGSSSPTAHSFKMRRSLSTTGMATPRLGQGVTDRARQLSTPNLHATSLAFDSSSLEDRLELVEALVHTADLGGQAYTAAVAAEWSTRVIQEFEQQAAKERREGLPVAPFMASLGTPLAGLKTQLSFLNNIMSPLWTAVGDLLPGLDSPLANINANRAHYQMSIVRLESTGEADGGAAHATGKMPAAPSIALSSAASEYSVAEAVRSVSDLDGVIPESDDEECSPTHASPRGERMWITPHTPHGPPTRLGGGSDEAEAASLP